MKVMVTGASGTVGRAVMAALHERDDKGIAWDRARVPMDDYGAMEGFVRQHQPDALLHLAVASQSTGRANEGWLVNFHWTGELAWICRQLGVRFLFTSSVMVFTNEAVGPFTPQSVPDASEGYGYEKRQAEERAQHQNPDAVIARLGWQIGDAPGSNQMVDYLAKQAAEHGEIRASRRWYPACSFVGDTANALLQLATGNPGLYLVDSNTRWTFFEVASALNVLHGNRWKVVADNTFVYDQRMQDARVPIPSLEERLPQLD